MDADDNIICGTMSNVFFVADNSISTPSLDRCGVKGVMRRHVIESLSEQDISVQFKTLNLANLQGIQEVFVSNSQFGIMPVQSCADLRWPVGDTTRKIMSILADKGIRIECVDERARQNRVEKAPNIGAEPVFLEVAARRGFAKRIVGVTRDARCEKGRNHKGGLY